jgi:hypothetical protein
VPSDGELAINSAEARGERLRGERGVCAGSLNSRAAPGAVQAGERRSGDDSRRLHSEVDGARMVTAGI